MKESETKTFLIEAGLGLLVTTALALPWLFKFVPSTDLPNHVAVSAILARLLTGTDAFYQLNIQPAPYYLAYALLTPCIAAAGAYLGQRLFLTLVGVLTVHAFWLLGRSVGASRLAALGGIFLLYGTLYFWGFVSTLVGVPFILYGCVALLRLYRSGSSRDLLLATAAGIAATLSHVLLLPAWLLCVAAYSSMDPRRNARRAAIMCAVNLAPLLPWVLRAASSSTQKSFDFETPTTWLHHLKMQIGTFDHGAGRMAHAVFLALVVITALFPNMQRSRIQPAHARFVGIIIAGSLMLTMLMPISFKLSDNDAWGVSFRYFTLAEAGLLLLLRPTHARVVQAGLMCATAGFVAALGSFWLQFNLTVAPLDHVLSRMQPHHKLFVAKGAERYARAWPPVTSNLLAYYVAQYPGYANIVFSGGHIPVIARQRVQGGLGHEQLQFGDYDYVVVQGNDVQASPIVSDAGSITHAGMWRLYARTAEATNRPDT